PLRAGMVTDLAGYPWSSYIVHGLGKAFDLVDGAPVWASLGKSETARQSHWREWLHSPLTEKELARGRRSVSTGRPYGREAWSEGMAKRLGLDLNPRRRGRPTKQGKMN